MDDLDVEPPCDVQGREAVPEAVEPKVAGQPDLGERRACCALVRGPAAWPRWSPSSCTP
jgi:hypothetical protein